MSTPLKLSQKQKSVDSPETVILKMQKKDFTRPTSVYERRISGTPDAHSQPTGRTSPLKRFGLAKESINKTFGLIKTELLEAHAILVEAKGGESGEGGGRTTVLLEKTAGIEEILARDHMKVAFFGRTSNGKSTVVNALLHDKVLPAGIGHTTNCFLSVIGVDEDKGYVIVPGSGEHSDIKSLQQLANSLHKERLSTNSLLRVCWPKEKCALLQEDVEFVDSPGIDMNPDVDDWINSHCLDADVFVLVSNAESTLMNAEKNFFHRVSERLSRPNIFILNNRWDVCVEEEPSMVEEVKQQHLENDISFLSNQLSVIDPDTARERVYFVSAKEVVTIRNRQRENQSDLGRGLHDGYKGRLLEFERFELKFKECLSNSAIKTKFEQHHSRGLEIVLELEELLNFESEQATQKNSLIQSELQEICSKQQNLNDKGHLVYQRSIQKTQSMAAELESRVQAAMEGILGHIATVADEYKPQEDFDHTKTETFKAGLYSHIDESVQKQLTSLCPATLGDVHRTTCSTIVSDYQQLLGLTQEQVTEYQLEPPLVSRTISCKDLCKDFREDLEFRFSLGIFSFSRWVNTGSIMFTVQRHVSRMSSIVPAELLLPVSLLGGGMIVSHTHLLRPVT
uniref:Dynamin-type G domain-containing protein n=1 Tax=Amphimedon queenslandica TaxID=400682 RepID=A0A1X7VNF0_AMPQE